MPRPTENESMQNNSTHTSTPNCESVEILFGLNPQQLYFSAGWFFDHPRMLATALIEIINSIRNTIATDGDNADVSIPASYVNSMRVMVNLEKLMPAFREFFAYFESTDNNADWLELLNENSEKASVIRECVMSLHYGLLDVVCEVEKLDFVRFAADSVGAISEINNKLSYDDVTVAFACINALYVAYITNKLSVKLKS